MKHKPLNWNAIKKAVRCNVNIDSTDLANSAFEVQVKYADGWRPLFSCSAANAMEIWQQAKRRYRHSKMRLVKDGKTVKENRA